MADIKSLIDKFNIFRTKDSILNDVAKDNGQITIDIQQPFSDDIDSNNSLKTKLETNIKDKLFNTEINNVGSNIFDEKIKPFDKGYNVSNTPDTDTKTQIDTAPIKPDTPTIEKNTADATAIQQEKTQQPKITTQEQEPEATQQYKTITEQQKPKLTTDSLGNPMPTNLPKKGTGWSGVGQQQIDDVFNLIKNDEEKFNMFQTYLSEAYNQLKSTNLNNDENIIYVPFSYDHENGNMQGITLRFGLGQKAWAEKQLKILEKGIIDKQNEEWLSNLKLPEPETTMDKIASNRLLDFLSYMMPETNGMEAESKRIVESGQRENRLNATKWSLIKNIKECQDVLNKYNSDKSQIGTALSGKNLADTFNNIILPQIDLVRKSDIADIVSKWKKNPNSLTPIEKDIVNYYSDYVKAVSVITGKTSIGYETVRAIEQSLPFMADFLRFNFVNAPIKGAAKAAMKIGGKSLAKQTLKGAPKTIGARAFKLGEDILTAAGHTSVSPLTHQNMLEDYSQTIATNGQYTKNDLRRGVIEAFTENFSERMFGALKGIMPKSNNAFVKALFGNNPVIKSMQKHMNVGGMVEEVSEEYGGAFLNTMFGFALGDEKLSSSFKEQLDNSATTILSIGITSGLPQAIGMGIDFREIRNTNKRFNVAEDNLKQYFNKENSYLDINRYSDALKSLYINLNNAKNEEDKDEIKGKIAELNKTAANLAMEKGDSNGFNLISEYSIAAQNSFYVTNKAMSELKDMSEDDRTKLVDNAINKLKNDFTNNLNWSLISRAAAKNITDQNGKQHPTCFLYTDDGVTYVLNGQKDNMFYFVDVNGNTISKSADELRNNENLSVLHLNNLLSSFSNKELEDINSKFIDIAQYNAGYRYKVNDNGEIRYYTDNKDLIKSNIPYEQINRDKIESNLVGSYDLVRIDNITNAVEDMAKAFAEPAAEQTDEQTADEQKTSEQQPAQEPAQEPIEQPAEQQPQEPAQEQPIQEQTTQETIQPTQQQIEPTQQQEPAQQQEPEQEEPIQEQQNAAEEDVNTNNADKKHNDWYVTEEVTIKDGIRKTKYIKWKKSKSGEFKRVTSSGKPTSLEEAQDIFDLEDIYLDDVRNLEIIEIREDENGASATIKVTYDNNQTINFDVKVKEKRNDDSKALNGVPDIVDDTPQDAQEQQGGTGNAATGERTKDGERTADSGRGTDEVRTEQQVKSSYVEKQWSENDNVEEMKQRLEYLSKATEIGSKEINEVFPEYKQFEADKKALLEKYNGSVPSVPKDKQVELLIKYKDFIDRRTKVFNEISSLRDAIFEAEEKASIKAKEQTKKEKLDKIQNSYNGYLKGLSNFVASRIDKALSKKVNINGEVKTIAEFIEEWKKNGNLEPEKKEFKPHISRSRWNKMDQYEQKEWEKAHEKGKTEYLVNGYILGKTAYDYANWLLSNKPIQQVQETNELGKKSAVSVQEQVQTAKADVNTNPTDKQKKETKRHRFTEDDYKAEDALNKKYAKELSFLTSLYNNDDIEESEFDRNVEELQDKLPNGFTIAVKDNKLAILLDEYADIDLSRFRSASDIAPIETEQKQEKQNKSNKKGTTKTETDKEPKEVKLMNAAEKLHDKAVAIPGYTVFEYRPEYYADGSGALVYGNKKSATAMPIDDIKTENIADDIKFSVLSPDKRKKYEAISKIRMKSDYAEYLIKFEGCSRADANMIAMRAGEELQSMIKYAKDSLVNDRFLRDALIPLFEEVLGKEELMNNPIVKNYYDNVRFEKTNGQDAVSQEEAALRDALIDKVREAGIDVITDTEEGQRVLDEANGNEISQQKTTLDAVIEARDKEYLEAVRNGDLDKAQRMVVEAAKVKGYNSSSQYQGTSAFNGAAPWGNGYFLTKEERKEAWDNDEYDGDQTLGDYIHRGIDAMNIDFIVLDPRNYRAADPMRKEAIDNVRNAIQKKSETITMYRSVPSDVKEGSFRNGDWVTPSRAYAVENAKVHGWGDNFNIIEQKVPVDEIWWDGNDIAEWGYGREEDFVNDKDFAYKNTKNNRKLLDAVTYDDNGNVIPLSKRFNARNSDIRFFRTSDGHAYGFTVGGKIYIDQRIATSDTPIHEYAHLWASAMRKLNPKEWENIVELMKGTPIWDEVKRNYPELTTDNEIADEVLAFYSGSRGAERLREEHAKILKGNGNVVEKVKAINAIKRVREALKRFWKNVADWFGIHFTTAEEVADKVLSDLLNGVNPTLAGIENDIRFEENSEEADIVARAKADGTYMKAPNGKQSNLSPRQWVQVRTKAFKDWFGDWENDPDNSSKVVDENGEPMVVYHGTPTGGFFVFNNSEGNSDAYSMGDNMFFFSTSKNVADGYSTKLHLNNDGTTENDGHRDMTVKEEDLEVIELRYKDGSFREYAVIYKPTGEQIPNAYVKKKEEAIPAAIRSIAYHYYTNNSMVYDAFLNIRNPYIIDANGNGWRTILGKSGENIIQIRSNNEYDGIIARNIDDAAIPVRSELADDIIAFSPTQIKSATDNIGTFDRRNPDIRYRRASNRSVISNRFERQAEIQREEKNTKSAANIVLGNANVVLNDTNIFDEQYQNAIDNNLIDENISPLIDSFGITWGYQLKNGVIVINKDVFVSDILDKRVKDNLSLLISSLMKTNKTFFKEGISFFKKLPIWVLYKNDTKSNEDTIKEIINDILLGNTSIDTNKLELIKQYTVQEMNDILDNATKWFEKFEGISSNMFAGNSISDILDTTLGDLMPKEITTTQEGKRLNWFSKLGIDIRSKLFDSLDWFRVVSDKTKDKTASELYDAMIVHTKRVQGKIDIFDKEYVRPIIDTIQSMLGKDFGNSTLSLDLIQEYFAIKSLLGRTASLYKERFAEYLANPEGKKPQMFDEFKQIYDEITEDEIRQRINEMGEKSSMSILQKVDIDYLMEEVRRTLAAEMFVKQYVYSSANTLNQGLQGEQSLGLINEVTNEPYSELYQLLYSDEQSSQTMHSPTEIIEQADILIDRAGLRNEFDFIGNQIQAILNYVNIERFENGLMSPDTFAKRQLMKDFVNQRGENSSEGNLYEITAKQKANEKMKGKDWFNPNSITSIIAVAQTEIATMEKELLAQRLSYFLTNPNNFDVLSQYGMIIDEKETLNEELSEDERNYITDKNIVLLYGNRHTDKNTKGQVDKKQIKILKRNDDGTFTKVTISFDNKFIGLEEFVKFVNNNFKYEELRGLSKAAAPITAWFSRMYTILSPLFPTKNLFKDLMVTPWLPAKELNGKNSQYAIKNFYNAFNNLSFILKMSFTEKSFSKKGFENKLKARSQELFEYYLEYSKQHSIFSIEDQIGALSKENKTLQDIERALSGKENKFIKFTERALLIKFMQHYAELFENLHKFSAYVTLRKLGYGEERSAQIANNATLNYDRSGSIGRQLNAIIPFAKAAFGGLYRTNYLLPKYNPKGFLQRVITLAVLGVMQGLMYDPDDDDISEFARKSGMVFGSFLYPLLPEELSIVRPVRALVIVMAGKKSPAYFKQELMESTIDLVPIASDALRGAFSYNPLTNKTEFDAGQLLANTDKMTAVYALAMLAFYINENKNSFGKNVLLNEETNTDKTRYGRTKQDYGFYDLLARAYNSIINGVDINDRDAMSNKIGKNGERLMTIAKEDVEFVINNYVPFGRLYAYTAEIIYDAANDKRINKGHIPLIGGLFAQKSFGKDYYLVNNIKYELKDFTNDFSQSQIEDIKTNILDKAGIREGIIYKAIKDDNNVRQRRKDNAKRKMNEAFNVFILDINNVDKKDFTEDEQKFMLYSFLNSSIMKKALSIGEDTLNKNTAKRVERTYKRYKKHNNENIDADKENPKDAVKKFKKELYDKSINEEELNDKLNSLWEPMTEQIKLRAKLAGFSINL